MLNTTQKWLEWSLLTAKVPKCAAISIHGHTGKCTNPHLSISNERIPFLGSKSTSFLWLTVNATLSTDSIKEQLQLKLERYLNLTDQSPLSRQQKLRIYKEAICPRLSWLLSLVDLPLTWIERTLEPLAIEMLKKWCGLSRPADPSRIFFTKTNGGLGIPSLTICYKKAQISRYSQLMTSKDSTCRFLAERQHMQDTGTQKKLKPTEEVIATMLEHPGATGSKLAVEARKRIVSRDEANLTTHASSLMKERDLFAIKEKDDELWSSTVTKLPENLFAFAMAASVDSLPHNSNLCRWRKLSSDLCTICFKVGIHCKQTLAHVLSHCQAALQSGRYNTRHDCVLEILFKHLQQHLPPGTTVVADLPGYPYTLPTDVPTDLRPDLVVHSPGQLHLLELTVCWESNFSAAKLMKESKYLHLVAQARGRGVQASLSTIQIGCRGFVDSKSLQHFFALTQTSPKAQKTLTSEIISTVIRESHTIWALRNQ